MTKEEFINKVSDILQKNYKYSVEKVNKYFGTPEAKEVLEDDYKYLNDSSMSISPEATASTLDLMY